MDRYSHPVGFWVYVSVITVVLSALAGAALMLTDSGVVRLMVFGALLILASLLYSPSTLDMTGWTLAVYAMMPAGFGILIGTPIVYALFVVFLGPYIEIRVK